MGSGKSTVGKLLAAGCGREFVDTDRLVVQRAGRSIEEIFRADGEARFRELEWEALRSLGGGKPVVAATGGGLFLAVRARRWLKKHGITAWLDAPLESCLSRVRGAAGRPLWDPLADPVAFRAMFERRRAAYALANIRVTASGPAQAVAETLARRAAPDFP